PTDNNRPTNQQDLTRSSAAEYPTFVAAADAHAVFTTAASRNTVKRLRDERWSAAQSSLAWRTCSARGSGGCIVAPANNATAALSYWVPSADGVPTDQSFYPGHHESFPHPRFLQVLGCQSAAAALRARHYRRSRVPHAHGRQPGNECGHRRPAGGKRYRHVQPAHGAGFELPGRRPGLSGTDGGGRAFHHCRRVVVGQGDTRQRRFPDGGGRTTDDRPDPGGWPGPRQPCT